LNTGIYIHIPFCRSRCSYCDFNTYIDQSHLQDRYVRALIDEIRACQPAAFSTLFFGGGTPSLLTPNQIGGVIRACRDHLGLIENAEVTMECNPGTTNLAYLDGIRASGVNRLSFGAQTANANELRLLHREHEWGDVARAVRDSRAAGFDNLNLDLIFGLPYQSLESWRETLEAMLALEPEHLSLYALIIEQGTPMHDWTRRGEVPFPDPDLAADMYELAEKMLSLERPERSQRSGRLYEHYEISNWCKPGRECQHNLIYWRNEPYLGLGAGAHGSAITHREWRARKPAEYVQRAERGESTIAGSEEIDPRTSMGETMMVGLRLLQEGVTHARFAARHGAAMKDVFGAELAESERKGLLVVNDERAVLTERGRFLSNQVFKLFV